MNGRIAILIALVVTMFVVPAGAETMNVRGEVVDAAFQIAPFTWNAQNFAGLYYDVNRDLVSDLLTTTVAIPNTIECGDLLYTAYRAESEYANPEIGEYFAVGWFGAKCMAINGKPYMLSPIILEMDCNEGKTLATGEEWHLGNGYSLIATQIDLEGEEVWLTLKKNGTTVYSSVIAPGSYGDYFNNRMNISGSLGAYTVSTSSLRTTSTFVYQIDVGCECHVPIFSVYVGDVFRGADSNIVRLKYAMLVDDDPTNVIADGAGNLSLLTLTPELVRLDNYAQIDLDMDSDIHIAEDLWLRVADDLDGNCVRNYRYHPYIKHEFAVPEPDPSPTPPPSGECVEIRGEVAEPTGNRTEVIVWNASNFAALWYDLNGDLMTETMWITSNASAPPDYGRTIDEGDIEYETKTTDVDFDYGGWGSYRAIGFITEKHFAGYDWNTSYEITDGDVIDLLSNGMLSKVLIDEDDVHVLATGDSLVLREGYELKLLQLCDSGDCAQLELLRNGISVDTATVVAPDTYLYGKDLGGLDDVPIIAIHISGIFAGTGTDIVMTDGVFQISERHTSVNAGGRYGEMEVTNVSESGIAMQSYDDISLHEGTVIDLMGNIKLVVADNETLRFAPVEILTEPGTYEVRGAVQRLNGTQGDEILWNASNFAALWYKIDDDVATETLSIAPGTLAEWDRVLDEDRITYTTRPVYQEYALHENEDLTVGGHDGYLAEGWIGEPYVAINESADELCKLLVEFGNGDKKTLIVGEEWNLGGGFTLVARQIDVEGNKAWLSLHKNGSELDDTVVTQDSAYTYTADIGSEVDVPIFSCYVTAVFRGTDTNLVQLKYVFLIDDEVLRIEIGDTYGAMEVVNAGSGETVLTNHATTITLDCDTREHIMGDMYFKTADDSTILRFYPMAERTIGDTPYEGVGGAGNGGADPQVPDVIVPPPKRFEPVLMDEGEIG